MLTAMSWIPPGRASFSSLLSICVLACASQKTAELPPEKPKPLAVPDEEEKPSEPDRAPSGRAWADSTFSPRPGSVPDPELEPLVDACGRGDAALHTVAAWAAESQAETGDPPSLDAVNFELRRAGSPYVMPRLWSAVAAGDQSAEIQSHVDAWTKGKKARGQLRCGGGLFEKEDGSRVLVLLQVDVLAELTPLPTRASPGSWITLDVAFALPTTAASVVLLPPRGAPRNVTTTMNGGDRARARFVLETPGVWLVQVMATQEGGPLPVATALISAGEAPPDAFDGRPVPGEKAYDATLKPEDALFVLVNAAREEQGLPRLKRNRTLDRAARAHSEKMRDLGRISHDTGHGDPAHRVAAVGLSPKATGENVALASSVVRLHRALWNSPSHRENLLLRRWDEMGIGIVERSDDGALLATELFIDP